MIINMLWDSLCNCIHFRFHCPAKPTDVSLQPPIFCQADSSKQATAISKLWQEQSSKQGSSQQETCEGRHQAREHHVILQEGIEPAGCTRLSEMTLFRKLHSATELGPRLDVSEVAPLVPESRRQVVEQGPVEAGVR